MSALQTITETEARSLTVRIREAVDDLWRLVYEAHTRQAWQVLGYVSWTAYVGAEFWGSSLNSIEPLAISPHRPSMLAKVHVCQFYKETCQVTPSLYSFLSKPVTYVSFLQ